MKIVDGKVEARSYAHQAVDEAFDYIEEQNLDTNFVEVRWVGPREEGGTVFEYPPASPFWRQDPLIRREARAFFEESFGRLFPLDPSKEQR